MEGGVPSRPFRAGEELTDKAPTKAHANRPTSNRFAAIAALIPSIKNSKHRKLSYWAAAIRLLTEPAQRAASARLQPEPDAPA
jgi:hypothetical protein